MNIVTLGLSTYRLTKLAMDDEITRELREKVYTRIQGNQKLEYLASCPWCLSIYAGALAVVLDKTLPETNTLLASSAITGLIYTHLG